LGKWEDTVGLRLRKKSKGGAANSNTGISGKRKLNFDLSTSLLAQIGEITRGGVQTLKRGRLTLPVKREIPLIFDVISDAGTRAAGYGLLKRMEKKAARGWATRLVGHIQTINSGY